MLPHSTAQEKLKVLDRRHAVTSVQKWHHASGTLRAPRPSCGPPPWWSMAARLPSMPATDQARETWSDVCTLASRAPWPEAQPGRIYGSPLSSGYCIAPERAAAPPEARQKQSGGVVDRRFVPQRPTIGLMAFVQIQNSRKMHNQRARC